MSADQKPRGFPSRILLSNLFSAGLYKNTNTGCTSGSQNLVSSYGFIVANDGNPILDLTNGTFTVPAGGTGWWSFDVYHSWDSNTSGGREVWLYINGNAQDICGHSPADTNLRATFLELLTPGMKVSFKVLQSSGSTINCTSFKFTGVLTAPY